MTDNTRNTQQCDREVDLTSPGIMTLPSQLGLAPIPNTFLIYTTGENTVDRAAGFQSIYPSEL